MLSPNLKSLKVGGELAARLEMAMKRLLREDRITAREDWACTPYSVDYLVADLAMSATDGSPCGHWAGDEAGRYINVLSALYVDRDLRRLPFHDDAALMSSAAISPCKY